MTRLFWLALTMREHLWYDRNLMGRLSSIRGRAAALDERGDWGQPVSLLFPSGPMQRISARTDIAQQVEWLLRFLPHCLLTYPSNLDGIVQHCARHGLRLPGLVDIRTISEVLSPRIREAAERTLGAKVIDQYSANEVGSIALQCPASGLYHVMAEGVIVEVLDEAGHACREGEIGRVVVTNLHNFATPLVRYDIGDYAEPAGVCPCGRGLPTLKRILGRERNLIRIPDGTRHWPLLGFFVYQDIAPIVQFQFVQYELDKIEVRLVTRAPLSADQEAALARSIHKSLTYPFSLRFRYFDTEIPRGAEGKFEQFICLVE
jgi:phenylacetate-CoA ligase